MDFNLKQIIQPYANEMSVILKHIIQTHANEMSVIYPNI